MLYKINCCFFLFSTTSIFCYEYKSCVTFTYIVFYSHRYEQLMDNIQFTRCSVIRSP